MTRGFLALSALLAACGGANKPQHTPAQTPADPVVLARAPTPPAEEDFEVISGVGTLSAEQVIDSVEPHVAAMMQCVQEQAREAPWLGGDIEIEWDVDASGQVAAVRLRKSSLGSWPAEACIVGRAGLLVFPAPKGGPATVALPMEIPPAKRPLVADEARMRGALRPALARLQDSCGGAGEVMATAYIGERAQVLSIGFAGPAVDSRWADCAVLEAKKWTIPANRGYISKVEFAPLP